MINFVFQARSRKRTPSEASQGRDRRVHAETWHIDSDNANQPDDAISFCQSFQCSDVESNDDEHHSKPSSTASVDDVSFRRQGLPDILGGS